MAGPAWASIPVGLLHDAEPCTQDCNPTTGAFLQLLSEAFRWFSVPWGCLTPPPGRLGLFSMGCSASTAAGKQRRELLSLSISTRCPASSFNWKMLVQASARKSGNGSLCSFCTQIVLFRPDDFAVDAEDMAVLPPHMASSLLKSMQHLGTINDVALEGLLRPGFQELNIAGCRGVTDGGVRTAVKAAGLSLERVDMSRCPNVGSGAVKALASNCGSITVLSLRFCGVTDGGLQHLRGLKCLRSLHLSSRELTDAGLRRLSKCAPDLVSLTLSFCPELTDAGLQEALCGMSRLQSLSLKGSSSISHFSVRSLNNCCPLLTELNLSRCPGVSDLFIADLVTSQFGKRALCLKLSYTKVSDIGLFFMAHHCGSLDRISLAGCEHVTQSGLSQLTLNSKTLRKIRLATCVIVRKSMLSKPRREPVTGDPVQHRSYGEMVVHGSMAGAHPLHRRPNMWDGAGMASTPTTNPGFASERSRVRQHNPSPLRRRRALVEALDDRPPLDQGTEFVVQESSVPTTSGLISASPPPPQVPIFPAVRGLVASSS